MTRLLHIADEAGWAEAERAGRIACPAGGFIHLCTEAQLAFVLGRHFAGRSGLVVLGIEAAGLDVRWEESELGMAPFPHLYEDFAGHRRAGGGAALMRVVGVSRVLNEADVIEPFLRHHAALLDLHILLDNGSYGWNGRDHAGAGRGGQGAAGVSDAVGAVSRAGVQHRAVSVRAGGGGGLGRVPRRGRVAGGATGSGLRRCWRSCRRA